MSMFPHTVTLYQTETITDEKYNDITINHITVLEGVLLIESKAANVRATGLEGADAVNLHIPLGVKATDGVTGEPKSYIPPVAPEGSLGWDDKDKNLDKSKYWTIAIGAVFVKGRVIEPTADRHQLELGYGSVYQATKVDKLDFGGFPHFEIGGN